MMKSAGAQWLALGMESWALGMEAATVIGLRGITLAAGDAAAGREAQRMVAEKVKAATDVNIGLMFGQFGTDPVIAARGVVKSYSRRVRANRRRLTGG